MLLNMLTMGPLYAEFEAAGVSRVTVRPATPSHTQPHCQGIAL